MWLDYVNSVGIVGAFAFAAFQTRRLVIDAQVRDKDRRVERALELYRDLVVEGDTATAFDQLSVLLRTEGDKRFGTNTWYLVDDGEFKRGGLLDPTVVGLDTTFQNLYRVLLVFRAGRVGAGIQAGRRRGDVSDHRLSLLVVGGAAVQDPQPQGGPRTAQARSAGRRLGPPEPDVRRLAESLPDRLQRRRSEAGLKGVVDDGQSLGAAQPRSLRAARRRCRECRHRVSRTAPAVVILSGPASAEDRIYFDRTTAAARSSIDIAAELERLGASTVTMIDITENQPVGTTSSTGTIW